MDNCEQSDVFHQQNKQKVNIVTGHDQTIRLLKEPDRVKEEGMAMLEIKKQMESLKQDASSHTNYLSRLMHEGFAIDVAAAWQR